MAYVFDSSQNESNMLCDDAFSHYSSRYSKQAAQLCRHDEPATPRRMMAKSASSSYTIADITDAYGDVRVSARQIMHIDEGVCRFQDTA